MSLFFNLPKEVKREEFDEFLENIKDDFPASEFPEIFIHYQQVNDKVLVLGIGKSAECGEQARRAYQENPELRKRKSDTRILRAPRNKFRWRMPIKSPF